VRIYCRRKKAREKIYNRKLRYYDSFERDSLFNMELLYYTVGQKKMNVLYAFVPTYLECTGCTVYLRQNAYSTVLGLAVSFAVGDCVGGHHSYPFFTIKSNCC